MPGQTRHGGTVASSGKHVPDKKTADQVAVILKNHTEKFCYRFGRRFSQEIRDPGFPDGPTSPSWDSITANWDEPWGEVNLHGCVGR
jgi:hypothetical protein